MILCIAPILDPAALAALRRTLDDAAFRDGRETAGWHARAVKRNEQAEAKGVTAAAAQVAQALQAHPVFQSAALPQRLSPVLFNRYAPGMEYGAHVDDALMGAGASRLRSDLSFTLYIDDPADYDGGALVIDSAGDEQSYKLEAGACILYPTTYLHRVAAVTRGQRRAAVGWVQSLVRDSARRELLFDLDAARRDVFERQGKSATFDRLAKTYANLLRMWAEP
ncbi:MAG: Fe2+-dependent dioxygenase [Rhodospirillaceae bacterium]|nr:Fe2+-dependent dioxygenase [Rhodospirillaceae bacterium]